MWTLASHLTERERISQRRKGRDPLGLHGRQVGGRLGTREDEIKRDEGADGAQAECRIGDP